MTNAIQQSNRSSAAADGTLNAEPRQRWDGSPAKEADGFATAGMSNAPAGEDSEPSPEEFDDALWRLASALLDVSKGSLQAHREAAYEEKISGRSSLSGLARQPGHSGGSSRSV